MTTAPRRIRLDLAYDGTDFAGWQIQPGQRTVQGVLETELARITGSERVAVRGAGRTDAGVHARRQVADCEIRTPRNDLQLGHALRSVLPADLRPLRLVSVPDEFHSRRDAKLKTYAYRLDLSLAGDPFLCRYALHHPRELDMERVREGLEALPGKRDWSGFSAAACSVEDRVRTVTAARLETLDDETAWLSFEGDGFLTHMVRNLVGTLLEIGRGRMEVERIGEILATRNRALAGPTAPAHGLCLMDIVYGGDRPGSPVRRD